MGRHGARIERDSGRNNDRKGDSNIVLCGRMVESTSKPYFVMTSFGPHTLQTPAGHAHTHRSACLQQRPSHVYRSASDVPQMHARMCIQAYKTGTCIFVYIEIRSRCTTICACVVSFLFSISHVSFAMK